MIFHTSCRRYSDIATLLRIRCLLFYQITDEFRYYRSPVLLKQSNLQVNFRFQNKGKTRPICELHLCMRQKKWYPNGTTSRNITGTITYTRKVLLEFVFAPYEKRLSCSKTILLHVSPHSKLFFLLLQCFAQTEY